MEKGLLISVITSLVYVIPNLVILAACIFYISKRTSSDAILMLVGSSIQILALVFNAVVMRVFMLKRPEFGSEVITKVYMFTGVISFIGVLAFAAGLFMLIYTVTTNLKNT